jgi:hypothetical protein
MPAMPKVISDLPRSDTLRKNWEEKNHWVVTGQWTTDPIEKEKNERRLREMKLIEEQAARGVAQPPPPPPQPPQQRTGAPRQRVITAPATPYPTPTPPQAPPQQPPPVVPTASVRSPIEQLGVRAGEFARSQVSPTMQILPPKYHPSVTDQPVSADEMAMAGQPRRAPFPATHVSPSNQNITIQGTPYPRVTIGTDSSLMNRPTTGTIRGLSPQVIEQLVNRHRDPDDWRTDDAIQGLRTSLANITGVDVNEDQYSDGEAALGSAYDHTPPGRTYSLMEGERLTRPAAQQQAGLGILPDEAAMRAGWDMSNGRLGDTTNLELSRTGDSPPPGDGGPPPGDGGPPPPASTPVFIDPSIKTSDGQSLATQHPDVQATYVAVHGQNAAVVWAADHARKTPNVSFTPGGRGLPGATGTGPPPPPPPPPDAPPPPAGPAPLTQRQKADREAYEREQRLKAAGLWPQPPGAPTPPAAAATPPPPPYSPGSPGQEEQVAFNAAIEEMATKLATTEDEMRKTQAVMVGLEQARIDTEQQQAAAAQQLTALDVLSQPRTSFFEQFARAPRGTPIQVGPELTAAMRGQTIPAFGEIRDYVPGRPALATIANEPEAIRRAFEGAVDRLTTESIQGLTPRAKEQLSVLGQIGGYFPTEVFRAREAAIPRQPRLVRSLQLG